MANILKLDYDIKEEQKDSYPSWIVNELVLVFQNIELLRSQERFESWIQKRQLCSLRHWNRRDKS